jgi:hypothetical protein
VVCSRFGGASFALAAVNIDAGAAGLLAGAISSRVASALAEQALTGEIQFHCGAAHFDAGAPSLPELLAAADLRPGAGKRPDAFDFGRVDRARPARAQLARGANNRDAIETTN